MLEPIAQWNPTTQLWETPQADLFSELPAPVLGDLAELGYDAEWSLVSADTIGARTDGTECSSPPIPGDLLPTPVAGDFRGHKRNIGDNPTLIGALLPTPAAADGHPSSLGRSNGVGHQRSLPGTVRELLPTPAAARSGRNRSASEGSAIRPSLDQVGKLLPTPVATDANGARNATRGGDRTNSQPGTTLGDVIYRGDLLPTPSAADGAGGMVTRGGDRSGELLLGGVARQLAGDADLFGPVLDLDDDPDALFAALNDDRVDYQPAIRRWENLTRPAPHPTEPNSIGGQRLNPEFSEWMQGWPHGHVTEFIVPTREADPAAGKITRNAALTIIGNGVVPQQAEHAIRDLLTRIAWRRVRLTPDQL